MAVELPEPIMRYFAADRMRAPEAVARCFTNDAVVRDEGHTHSGMDAIRRWRAEASSQYSYTVEPVAITAENGRTIVTGYVEGDFPGSPVNLHYAFRLEAGKVAELDIAPESRTLPPRALPCTEAEAEA